MVELNEQELEEISGGKGVPPVGPYKTHVVKSGECLSAIAQQYGTSVQFLVRLNNIQNPDVLKVKQKLIVPNPSFGK